MDISKRGDSVSLPMVVKGVAINSVLPEDQEIQELDY